MFCCCYDIYVFDGRPPDLKKQELAKGFSKREDAFEELAVAIAVYASLSLSLSLMRTRGNPITF